MSIQDNIWAKFISGFEPNLQKMFASRAWKQAFLPFLEAQREVCLRSVIDSKDHMEIDRKRGMVLAFEMMMNFPAAVGVYEKQKAETKAPEEQTTLADDAVYFEEEN